MLGRAGFDAMVEEPSSSAFATAAPMEVVSVVRLGNLPLDVMIVFCWSSEMVTTVFRRLAGGTIPGGRFPARGLLMERLLYGERLATRYKTLRAMLLRSENPFENL